MLTDPDEAGAQYILSVVGRLKIGWKGWARRFAP